MKLAHLNPATLALGLLLASCAAVPPAPPPTAPETPQAATKRRTEAPRPTYNLTGYPPAVREGYIDGCESAKHSSYAHKDAARMTNDPQYSMGWNDGFSMCKH